MASSTTLKTPTVLKDPRFRAGTKLITSGRAGEGAIDIFGLLLEEARTKFGESSIETAPVYYEYGNSLFRSAQRRQLSEEGEVEGEKRATKEGEDDIRDDKKPAAVDTKREKGDEQEIENNDEEGKNGDEDEGDAAEKGEDGESKESDDDDVTLALSVMETSFAITDEYSQSNDTVYQEWVNRVHMPRALAGIGDVLSFLGRHADAVDVYTRSLHYRETNLESYNGKEMSMDELRDRRKTVEANVLVAEELLACPKGEDVVTTETKDCLVKAAERIEYVEGYYNKARDQLQETLLLMGKLATEFGESKEFLEEKEDISYASVLVMDVGEQLSALEEQKQLEESVEPTKKKAKR